MLKGIKIMSFVSVTKEQFESSLPKDFEIIALPNCKEIVYQIPSENPDIKIRIYSSIDIRTNISRDVGSDAIRIVYWDTKNDRPLGKGKKIYRTEGKTTIQERIQSRINDFQAATQDQEIIDFEYVKTILNSDSISQNGFAQSLLESLEKYKRLTDNQLAYVLGEDNPKGRPTMEAQVKIKDPNFLENYLNNLEEEKNEITKKIEVIERNPKGNERQDEIHKEENKKNFSELGSKKVEQLISTKSYDLFQYPFQEFNPVQTQVIPYVSKDRNMVISANTSAGKTICAELLIDETIKHNSLLSLKYKNKKVIYTSPLKSLSNEKFVDWQKRFPDRKILMLTGDTLYNEKERKKQMKQAVKADIIITTTELLDSVTRRIKTDENYWLNKVGLLVIDEAHIISAESRGHAVETGIMRFTSINSEARILFLSATMPNVQELADWLSSLNQKETTIIFSRWRPVKLNMNYEEYPIAYNRWGQEDYWTNQERKKQKAVEIALSKPDEKFLVFVHDKGTGRDIVRRLKIEGAKTEFHNADLELKDRQETEDSFQDRDNGIRVLVSTSTLAYGRNLPARNVIIVGIHRGLNKVDSMDIIQESGRAGRLGLDDAGFVYLIIPEGTTNHWEEVFKNPKSVNSVLNEKATLAFHVLAEIQTRSIKNESDLFDWYKRSLAYKQDLKPFTKEDTEILINELIDMQMISRLFNRLQITGLGRVSAWLYFSPYNVYAWYKNFSKIFESGISDKFLAWALADIPSNDLGYVRKDLKRECDDWRYDLNAKGIHSTDALPSVIGAYNCLSNIDSNSFNTYKRGIIFDIDRQCQALSLIDKYAEWRKEDLWKSLPLRIKYGIPEKMVDLVKLPGIGGVRARKLWDTGFKSLADVSNIGRKTELMRIFKPDMVKKIQKIAKNILIKKEIIK